MSSCNTLFIVIFWALSFHHSSTLCWKCTNSLLLAFFHSYFHYVFCYVYFSPFRSFFIIENFCSVRISYKLNNDRSGFVTITFPIFSNLMVPSMSPICKSISNLVLIVSSVRLSVLFLLFFSSNSWIKRQLRL